jgi:hypothetical protein
MPCHVVDLPGGHHAIVKTAYSKPKTCKFCGQRPVSKLCDYKISVGDVGHTRTCDAGMCAQCAYPVAPDVDYCPDHRPKGNRHGVAA